MIKPWQYHSRAANWLFLMAVVAVLVTIATANRWWAIVGLTLSVAYAFVDWRWYRRGGRVR